MDSGIPEPVRRLGRPRESRGPRAADPGRPAAHVPAAEHERAGRRHDRERTARGRQATRLAFEHFGKMKDLLS